MSCPTIDIDLIITTPVQPEPTVRQRGSRRRRRGGASRPEVLRRPRAVSPIDGERQKKQPENERADASLRHDRKYDRPAYTLSTFVPRPVQPFYLALRALNVSLSMIPDTTSSHTIGLMRLQFWRDAVTKALAGAPPKEPVAVLLAAAIADRHEQTQGRARISKRWLTRMIDAREQTLTNDPYPNLAALETYAENTYSTLMYLTLAALPLTSVTADHVASHIGKATGIVAILKGLPLVAFPPPAPRPR